MVIVHDVARKPKWKSLELRCRSERHRLFSNAVSYVIVIFSVNYFADTCLGSWGNVVIVPVFAQPHQGQQLLQCLG